MNDFTYDVWYMFVRSWKKFVGSPALIFFSVFTPVIFLVLFTQLFSSLGNDPGFPAGGYIQFAVAGILLMMNFSTALQSGSSIVDDYNSEYLSKLLVTPVSRPAILLGRLLSDALRIVLQSAILLILAYLMGATFITGAPGILLIFVTMALFGIAFSGVSLSIGLATKSAETISGLSMFLTFPLIFISTAFMPIESLPNWMQTVSSYNPLTYVTDALRVLTSTGFEWGTILSAFGVLLVIALLGLGTTMHQFRKMMR
jgi:ABC-2 type transport system permease protein